MSATVHSVPSPPNSRPSDGEIIIRLDADESGKLAVGRISGGPASWPTADSDRREWFTSLLDRLVELADGRKLRREREGVFHIAVDADSEEITDVWTFAPWLKDSTDAADIRRFVSE